MSRAFQKGLHWRSKAYALGSISRRNAGESYLRHKNKKVHFEIIKSDLSFEDVYNASILYGKLINSADSYKETPRYSDSGAKRRSLHLAASAFKYRFILEKVVDDSKLFQHMPINLDYINIAMVMIFNMQMHKFYRIDYKDFGFSVNSEKVKSVESSLKEYQVKLHAAFARNRIKSGALTIEQFLSEDVRQKEIAARKMSVYAWINTNLTSIENVFQRFADEGFQRVDNESLLDKGSYCVDGDLQDVIIFSSANKNYLTGHYLAGVKHVVIQSKALMVFTEAVATSWNDQGEILITHTYSIKQIAHLSSLLKFKNFKIRCLGIRGHEKIADFERQLQAYGAIRGITLSTDNFLKANPASEKYIDVKVILVQPPSTFSGITNIVDFILCEDKDEEDEIIRSLSKRQCEETEMIKNCQHQTQSLLNAMRFANVQSVIYCTLSTLAQENICVVERAFKQYETVTASGGDIEKHFKKISVSLPGKYVIKTWKISFKTDFPNMVMSVDSSKDRIQIQPSASMDGCFLIKLFRQDETLSPNEVIERKKSTESERRKAIRKNSFTFGPENNEIEKFENEFLTSVSAVSHGFNTNSRKSARIRKRSPRIRELATPVRRFEKLCIIASHKQGVQHPSPFR